MSFKKPLKTDAQVNGVLYTNLYDCSQKSDYTHKKLLCPNKSTIWQVQMKTQDAERAGKKPWELSLFRTGLIKQNFKVRE